MTDERLNRELPGLLDELSLPAVTDYLDDILSQTARMRQRPGWTFPERWLPMDIAVQRSAGVRQFPWRTVGVVALLGALLATAILVAGSRPRLPTPFGPAANGSLIYEKRGNIFIADADATHERLLIGGETNDYAVTWSRDGTKLFFGRDVLGGVSVMTADPDGRKIRELSAVPLSAPAEVDVSPLGTELAVSQIASGGRTISILSLTGDRAARDLDLGALIPDRFVGWRPPAGDEIVFVATAAGSGPDLGVYAIRADGSGLRQVAMQRGESEPGQQDPTQYSFQGMKLSPDGRTAAYWNWEPTVQPPHGCFIHLLDLTTGQDRRMSYDPEANCELGPEFTPDGSRIVAERQSAEGMAQLFLALADGSAPRLLGSSYQDTSRRGFALSPDGMTVVFVPLNGTGQVISIADGSVHDTDVEFISLPSWQRLAP